MNPEKLKKLQAQAAQVRIGGKGTPRRKKKIVHQTAATDDKKLQSSLKKLAVNNIPGIEEVNMIKNDGTVIHFNNPKTQASLAANTFAITGHGETKQIAEMLPGILTQLGQEGLAQLKRLASNVVVGNKILSSVEEEEKDDIPDLIENFENVMNSGEDAKQAPAAQTTEVVTDKKVDVKTTSTVADIKKEEVVAPAAVPTVTPTVPVVAATPAAAAEKKEVKKETTPKKSEKKAGDKGGNKKQQQQKSA